MLHVDETMLSVLLASGSVTHFALHPCERGFGVFLTIDAKGQGDAQRAMLITTRMKHKREKSPRQWASVDNFLEFLRSKAAQPPEIRIIFNHKGDGKDHKNGQH